MSEFLTALATRGLQGQQNFNQQQADQLPVIGKSLVAGTVGLPADLVVLASLPQILNNPNVTVEDAFKQTPMTADWLGEKMGVDVDSPAFILSQFLSPSPADVGVPLAKGAAKLAPETVAAIVGMFGGRKARNADLEALAMAEAMKESGATREEIWNATGWFEGVDGKWRFEIDDSQADFRGRDYIGEIADALEEGDMARAGEVQRERLVNPDYPAMSGKLRNRFEHPEWYEAYPEAGDIQYKPKKRMGDATGSYSPTGRSISISSESPRNIKRSYVLHEGQHDVQHLEDFAKGGDPSRLAAEWSRAKQEMDFYSSVSVLGREAEATQGGDVQKALEALNELGFELDQSHVDELARIGLDEANRRADETLETLKMYGRPGDSGSDPGMDIYRRTAGEVEARNVQKRKDMTPDERRANPPWTTEDTPADRQIVRFGYGGPERGLTPDEAAVMASMEPDTSYRIQHTAPRGGDDGSASLDKLDELFPDFYELDQRTRSQYYGLPNEPAMVEGMEVMARLRGNPDATVTIYRVVPGDVDSINSGDWVTQSRYYAEMMLDDPGIKNPKIIKQEVRAGDLYWNGDSPVELGYAPKSIGKALDMRSSLDSFSGSVKRRHGLDSFELLDGPGGSIELSLIKAQRGEGRGAEAMRDLLAYADANGRDIVLTPDPTMGGEKMTKAARSRLVNYYKQFGFVENKGRNKDFRYGGPTQGTVMYRRPVENSQ